MEDALSERRSPARLPDNPTSEEIDAFFRHDMFAYGQAGCRMVEAHRGHAVAEMVLDEKRHLNVDGNVMGGAIFTLADYAFAGATMCGRASSVSLSSTIEFMRATRGSKLIATCDVDHPGRKVGFYTIDVVDDEGVHVARVVASCYHPIDD